MYVRSASTFMTDPVDAAGMNRLKEELARYTDYFFRRVNKFIMLTLMGVHMCAFKKGLGEEAGIYLSTENGNLGDTENVLNQLYRRHSFPMPFNFINTMSNTASFYAAQSLKLTGPNISLSSRNLSFERGLELCLTDLACGASREALVGGVDEAVFSEAQWLEKFGRPVGDIRLVEGSCWLYLNTHREGAIGEISAVRSFPSEEEAREWLSSQKLPSPALIAFGLLIDRGEREAWASALPFEGEFDYIGEHGYFDSASSCGVCAFLNKFRNRHLVHVNRDFDGNCALILAQSY